MKIKIRAHSTYDLFYFTKILKTMCAKRLDKTKHEYYFETRFPQRHETAKIFVIIFLPSDLWQCTRVTISNGFLY